MICESGKCCVCEQDISTTCPTCGTRKFNDQHTKVNVTWSNGSVMPIGVCQDCAKSGLLNDAEVKRGITEAHWNYWESMGGTPDKEIVIV